MLVMVVLLVLNFAISCYNSWSVGRMWSESKVIGGSFRLYTVAGYVMAVAGFTMVYGCILLMAAPHVIPLLVSDLRREDLVPLMSIAGDMLYVLVTMLIVPSGFIVWYNTFIHFWRRKTLANGLTVAWNTYAQLRNSINAARHVPSALGRIIKALSGGRSKKGGGAVILLAVLIVVLAIFGGWMTASAIMKKADREFDGLADFSPEPQTA